MAAVPGHIPVASPNPGIDRRRNRQQSFEHAYISPYIITGVTELRYVVYGTP